MKTLLLSLSAIVAVISFTQTGRAEFISGNICTAAYTCTSVTGNNGNCNPAAVGSSLGPYGASNLSTTTSLVVNCALPALDRSYQGLTMFAYDRNASANVVCNEVEFDGNANVVQSGNVWTTSAGGPGTNAPQTIAGQTNFNGRIFTLQCTIPPAVLVNGTLWVSHLVGFKLLPLNAGP